MDELDRLYVFALGGGGLMNIIVGVVTTVYGPGFAPPINYILGGFLLGMLAMKYSQTVSRERRHYDNLR